VVRRWLTAVLLGAVSCGDGTGPGGLDGVFSFSYEAFVSGTFNVAAAAPTGPVGLLSNTSLTAGTTNNGFAVALGYKATVGGEGDLARVSINRTSVGSAPFLTECPESGLCAQFYFSIAGNATCELSTGTMTITQINNSRVIGTFSGTGTCGSGTGFTAFSVSNGTFNVARVPVGYLLS
jgi:hypothetical protein